jgi:hypothetical protein
LIFTIHCTHQSSLTAGTALIDQWQMGLRCACADTKPFFPYRFAKNDAQYDQIDDPSYNLPDGHGHPKRIKSFLEELFD